MIVLATLKDEMVAGLRRAAGKQIRKIIIVGLDNYNIVIAEGSDPANPVGKKFFGKLTHLGACLAAEYAELTEIARQGVLAFFEGSTQTTVGKGMTWAEMDDHFNPGKRCSDSSGKLQLYVDLRQGDADDDNDSEAEAA